LTIVDDPEEKEIEGKIQLIDELLSELQGTLIQ
jgi:hypothetical protein